MANKPFKEKPEHGYTATARRRLFISNRDLPGNSQTQEVA
jgi:hypothetical protein